MKSLKTGPPSHGVSRLLRALTVTAAIVVPTLMLIPGFVDRGGATTPSFSRPNVLVDSGPGWVESSMYGGPSIAVSSDGTIHAVWSDDRTGSENVYHAMSQDHGITWISELRIDGFIGGNNVAPSVTVDTSGGSSTGTVYVAFQSGDMARADVYVTRSIDGGYTWLPPYKVGSSTATSSSVYPRVAVDSTGFAYTVFMDKRTGEWGIYMVKSTDGGNSWSADYRPYVSANKGAYPSLSARGGVVAAAWEETGSAGKGLRVAVSIDNGVSWATSLIAGSATGGVDLNSVSIDVDNRGALHLAWVNVEASGDASIMYSQSLDRGATWSAFRQVDDAPALPSVFFESVSVVTVSSTTYVIWADSRNGDYDIFSSWSEDNGMTWSDGILNDNDVRVDDTDQNTMGGDDSSFQLSPFAADGAHGVYVLWMDSRDGVAAHAFFACNEIEGVLITEVRDSPESMEQVEIVNVGRALADLTGWTIVMDGTSYPLGGLGAIALGSHLTIGDPGLSDLPMSIDLGDEGGTVMIVDGSGKIIDRMGYGQLGKAPDPLIGESVSRVFSAGAYSDAWANSQIATFGARNSGVMPVINSDLVLNEVMFNAVNAGDRFVELFYKGNSSMNLTGYTLVGDVVHPLPPLTLLFGDVYHAIRAPSAPPLFSSMDATGDNLYLYDPAGSLIDMVGWSSPHTPDSSMSRVPDGYGTANGYDDITSEDAGWVFDQVPSLALVYIGPDQSDMGDVGDRILYGLIVTNKESVSHYINIEGVPGAQGWNIALLRSDGVTMLTDSPGDVDTIPDVGLVPAYSTTMIVVGVDIPTLHPPVDTEFSKVRATLSDDPIVSAVATLHTQLFPYESPNATANPSTIYVDSAPPMYQPQESTIKLNVTGRGSRIITKVLQDTMLLIDSSGSMLTSDPTNLRLAAAKHYVDLLEAPERAAVIDFDSIAILVNGDHLSSDYVRIKANIDTIDSIGATNLFDPIRIATDEFSAYGDPNHKWIQIMLTDGADTTGHSSAQILSQASRAASYGIQIFTIGLGTAIDEPLLMQIAAITGGMYLKADKPEDLDSIYMTLGNITKAIAGYDDNLYDDMPMISVFLPNYLGYIPSSSTPPAAYVGGYMGMTNLQWNLSQLLINETWTASFRVKSDSVGSHLLALEYPLSRVTYIRHDDIRVSVPFPETFLDVLAPPAPPDLTVNSADISFPDPQPYYLGGSVRIDAIVRNIGGTTSTATRGRFLDGFPPGLIIDTDRPLAPLAPGGSQQIAVVWTPTSPGYHDICVVADPDNLVSESDEGNNLGCSSAFIRVIPETRPDYIPTSPAPDSKVTIGLSLQVSLSIVVMNIGNASAAAGSTLAFTDRTGPPISTYLLAPLDALASSSRFSTIWTSPSSPGTYVVTAHVDFRDDIAEWDETNNAYTWTIDVVPGPVTDLLVGTPSYKKTKTYVTSSTDFSLSVLDLGKTGIRSTKYRVDYTTWTDYPPGAVFMLHGEGLHQIEWYSEDNAGNKEGTSSESFIVDNTPPTTTVSVGDPKYLAGGSFVTSRTKLELQATDGGLDPVGLDVTSFRIWAGVWSAWSDFHVHFTLDGADGVRYIEFWSDDRLGNQESIVNVSLIVDNTPPSTELRPSATSVSMDTWFNIAADDGKGSGVASLWKSLNQGSMNRHAQPFTLSKGTHKITYKAADNLGNTGESIKYVDVVGDKAEAFVVQFNYKPMVAFIFSIILLLAAAFSARRKPLRRWSGPKKRFIVSWSLLMLPFVAFEAFTGVLSISFEPFRIPPLIGWGTGVDLCALVVGCVFLIIRAVRKRLEEREEEKQETKTVSKDKTRKAVGPPEDGKKVK